jgi:hypothetical protein
MADDLRVLKDFTDWLIKNRAGKAVSTAMMAQSLIGFHAAQMLKARQKATLTWYGNWIEERSR